ncbi:unnamed protein product, partial [Rotaria sp. Silwood1]
MSKLDGAEMYYQSLLDELGANHPDIAKCYFKLGNLA